MISEEGCRIQPNNKDCAIFLKEMPRYKIVSYAGMRIKEGEQQTGDTYSFGKLEIPDFKLCVYVVAA